MNRIILKYNKEISVIFALLLVVLILTSLNRFGDKAIILFSMLSIGVIISGAIIIKPFCGILMIAALIPFENYQVLPGVGLTSTKILGLITLFSTIIHIISSDIKGIKKSPIDVPLFCFLTICFISIIPAEDKMKSIPCLIALTSYTIIFYLTGTILDSKRKILIVTGVLFSSIILVSLLNIFQSFGIDFGLSLKKSIQWVGEKRVVRYSGSFLNPNRFVTIQIIAFGISASFLGRLPLKLKPLLIVVGLILLYSVYISYSRSAYLALTAIFLVYLFINARRRLFFVIFLLVIAFWLLVAFLPESIMEHFHKGFSFEDTSTRTRLQQYIAALKIFPEHWLIGLGIGNQSSTMIGRQVGFDLLDTGLHCLPFSILIETGILGFAAFAWLIMQSALVLHRCFLKTEDRLMKGVFLGGILVLAGYMAHNLFHNFMYMSILGLTAGIYNAAYNVPDPS